MFKFVNITKVFEKNTGSFLFKNITLFYYKKIVKREIKLGNINSSSNVLCIGGGYFPATAILVSKLTKAKVTVIDNDSSTIDLARKRINKMKLDIDVVNIDGSKIDASGYDIVLIANQVSPKDVVVAQTLDTINKGKVLVRTPKKGLSKGYFKESLKETTNYIKQPFYSNIERTLMYEA